MSAKIRLVDRECPLSTTLGVVGDWWTVLILHDVFDGYTHFDQFLENLQISSSMLSSRLKTLVDEGLLERRQYQSGPARYEYVLTDLGRSLRPVLVAMAAWGNSRREPADRSVILLDTETGLEVEAIVVDERSGERLDDSARFVFAAGDGAGKPWRDRYAQHVKGQAESSN